MKRKSLNAVEQTFLNAVCTKIEEPVVNERLVYLFEWYTRKAQFNKRWYNWTRFITYLIPCLITLISAYASFIEGNGKLAIAIIATLSAFLVGIHHVIDHFRFYENWIRYRGAAEKLKREAELFLNRCEPYQRSSAESKKRFANRIERIAKDEILSWENLQEESYKPFKDETQSALQSGGSPAALNQAAAAAPAATVFSAALAEETVTISETACDSEEAQPDAPA